MLHLQNDSVETAKAQFGRYLLALLDQREAQETQNVHKCKDPDYVANRGRGYRKCPGNKFIKLPL
jgi:hypothetical protein